MPRRCLLQTIYTREKHLCKNLGVKEREGCFFEGDVFLELMVLRQITHMEGCSRSGSWTCGFLAVLPPSDCRDAVAVVAVGTQGGSVN